MDVARWMLTIKPSEVVSQMVTLRPGSTFQQERTADLAFRSQLMSMGASVPTCHPDTRRGVEPFAFKRRTRTSFWPAALEMLSRC
jgi:hypothetical protein